MEENKIKRNKIINIIVLVVLVLNLGITGYLLGSNIKSKVNESSLTTKYTLYIGTNDKDTYKKEHETEYYYATVNEICKKYTSGWTLFDAKGYWVDDNNIPTSEDTIGCILEDISKENVYKIADDIIVALNQNSVLIETNNVTTTFYSTAK